MRVEKQIAALRTAVKRLLEDYRTEGCHDPKCSLCKKSRQAKEYAQIVLKSVDAQTYAHEEGFCDYCHLPRLEGHMCDGVGRIVKENLEQRAKARVQ